MICGKCSKKVEVFKRYIDNEIICRECHKELTGDFCIYCGGQGVTQPAYLDGDYEDCKHCSQTVQEESS